MTNDKGILTLGIETSCDETSVSVVRNGNYVLSNVVASQIPIHRVFGGVVPEVASRNHIDVIDDVTRQAIIQAGITLGDIDLIGVTYGAGLVGALLVGVSYAKSLAQALNVPLMAVNHIEGHLCANYITHHTLAPPFISLMTSGGHTAISLVEHKNTYTTLCSTVDDAVGEAFDKVARLLGLPYPGGPEIDKLAQQGQPKIVFPSVLLRNGNFSYSGLKTAVANYINKCNMTNTPINREDLCASFTKSAIDGLIDRAVSCANKFSIRSIVLSGGVSANTYIRQRASQLTEQGYNIYMPQLCYCTDNGAMIASCAYYMYIYGQQPADLSLNACPTLKLRGEYVKKHQ
ncbi:MAG: tRNA (adenosine(37)-N6)-threonylcarbamoyltransferase complex transferase subunit TsaD [Clostridia bacterium]|nr:tRNA (adenosine(37)-N6)-threonylcarbamoyltransferase complex transferase subunit TsaD [Clostridia bacterium]